ncbi:hypothetical protein [Desulfocurvus sp. DL9XJH121]
MCDIIPFTPTLDLTHPKEARLRALVGGRPVRGVTAPNVVELRAKMRTLRPAALINHLNETPPPPAA